MAPPVNIDHLLYRLKAFGAPKAWGSQFTFIGLMQVMKNSRAEQW
jgi:hypothetical protein